MSFSTLFSILETFIYIDQIQYVLNRASNKILSVMNGILQKIFAHSKVNVAAARI